MANRSLITEKTPRREFRAKVRAADELHVCKGKVAFETYTLANEVACDRRKHSAVRQPYRCPHCDKYHVGAFLK